MRSDTPETQHPGEVAASTPPGGRRMHSIELLSSDAAGGRIYRARTHDGHAVELVDSTRPEEREWKRVFGLSTLLGCPVKCAVCDAGGGYLGRLTAEELLAQLDFLVHDAFPDGVPTVRELHVELTRMGEPSFNHGVLHFLAALPGRYGKVRVVPLLSSVGPARSEWFFDELLLLKTRVFAPGDFQMQFSLFTTDETLRRKMVPVRCWSFQAMAAWGQRFVARGDRKILLNVPATRELPVDVPQLRAVFNPSAFTVKLSPLNLSEAAARSGFTSLTEDPAVQAALVAALRAAGYEVVVTGLEDREDPTGCGRFFSAGLGPETPRRTLRP